MTNKTSPDDLNEFGQRLKRTRAFFKARDAQAYRKSSAYGFGFRLATDLVAGVLAGFGIGWLLDYAAGTSPWFLLIFTPLGVVAGILNVVRAAKSAEAKRHLAGTASHAPAVDEDDDD